MKRKKERKKKERRHPSPLAKKDMGVLKSVSKP
jgi:hypothetical protein